MYSSSFGIVVVASACYSFLLLVTIVSIEYCSTNVLVVTLGLLDILSLPEAQRLKNLKKMEANHGWPWNADGEARYGDDATMRRCDDATMRRYDPFLVKS